MVYHLSHLISDAYNGLTKLDCGLVRLVNKMIYVTNVLFSFVSDNHISAKSISGTRRKLKILFVCLFCFGFFSHTLVE